MNKEHRDRDVNEEIPLCSECLTPYHEFEHYCKKCGAGVGMYTPYMPFVNIPFNIRIWKKLWKKLWFDKKPLSIVKIFYLLLIIIISPFLLIGIPFVIWEKYRRKNNIEDKMP